VAWGIKRRRKSKGFESALRCALRRGGARTIRFPDTNTMMPWLGDGCASQVVTCGVRRA
jgi:hypothetical protein